MSKRKILIVILLVIGFLILTSSIFILGIKSAFDSKPIVRQNSVLRLVLSGTITERVSQDAFSREFEGASVQMHDIRQALQMAAVDKRIKGVFLQISAPSLGWAKAQEIKRSLSEFRESGKFVTALLDYCDEISYYIALAADDIFLQPHAFTMINGFAAESPFIKRTFDKLGVEAQVVNVGKYKSAGEIFERESMSMANREATAALLQDIYDHFVQTVCNEREVEQEKLERMLQDGVFRAQIMVDSGLLDALKYETEVKNILKAKIYSEEPADLVDINLELVNLASYARLTPDEVGLNNGEKIALIYAIGVILPGHSSHSPVYGRILGSLSIIKMLETASKDKNVRAVVLRIDSPGGSGQASDEIWAAIENVRQKKPVVVSMSDVAASGGYWISMNCDGIVSEPLTITGSIGVLSTLFNLSGTYDKLGIDWETVKIGKHADFNTDKRAMTSAELEKFKQLNNDFYQVFVQKVANGRHQSWDDIHAIAQGRIWTGQRALNLGLIDSLGGLETALAIAKEKAGLEQDVSIRWQVYPQPKGFFQSLVEKFNIYAAKTWLTEHRTISLLHSLPKNTRTALQTFALRGLLRRGEILTLAPIVPEIH